MENLIAINKSKSEIQSFFNGMSIFLTGGTGVVGQVLLEKLLRSCAIRNLYLLVREKKNKSPDTRVEELINTPVGFVVPKSSDVVLDGNNLCVKLFDRLKMEQPNFVRKIMPVIGDCEKPDLGISEADQAVLLAQINVVIHCAATVNFNEPLKRATFINIRSTRDLLILARRMNGLKAFVYVSSAFSNCNQNYIDEIIYKNHIQGDTLIKMAETMSDSIIDSMTNTLLKDWPNTYTLSKCIAENIVEQYRCNMPVCITRPGIVVSTYNEPFPGWTNNIIGVNGMSIGIGMGAIRVILAKDVKLGVVPSDRVANFIISSAWYTGVTGINNSIPVYNYISTNKNGLRLYQLIKIFINAGLKKKLIPKKQIWYPGVFFTSSKACFFVLFVILHYIPAFFIDIFLRFAGHEFSALRIYKKVFKMQNVLAHFSLNEFKFGNQNVMDLIKRQTVRDKALFHMDLADINWNTYYENGIRGGLKYVLHESTKPNIDTWRRIVVLHYGLLTIVFFAMLYFIVFLLNCVIM